MVANHDRAKNVFAHILVLVRVVEYRYVPVIRVRYGAYQKIKCAVPACRTIDVPANMTVTRY